MPYRKFTNLQRQELKQCIIEAVIQRMPRDQALEYIHNRLGKPISLDYFLHLKARYRKTAGQQIMHLQKDRYAYMQLFFDRIDELRTLQTEQWRIYHEYAHSPVIQQASLKELHQLTISIGNYYDALPSLTSAYAPSSLTKSPVSTAEGESSPTSTAEIPV